MVAIAPHSLSRSARSPSHLRSNPDSGLGNSAVWAEVKRAEVAGLIRVQYSSRHSAIRAHSHGEAGCHTTSNQRDLSPQKLHAAISQIDYLDLPCRLKRFVGLIQIGGINKLSAPVVIGSGASVNMAKDMHLGSLQPYGFEQLFAAKMGSVRSCLIEDSIRRTMCHEYIEGIWNAVPMHICRFTARIHKSPV